MTSGVGVRMGVRMVWSQCCGQYAAYLTLRFFARAHGVSVHRQPFVPFEAVQHRFDIFPVSF